MQEPYSRWRYAGASAGAACVSLARIRAGDRKKKKTSNPIAADIAAELNQNDCQLRTAAPAAPAEK